ncbi:ECF transporter S component [Mesobacillus maritimus]|uniref:ECF transporter S component n=1 Tax=Mesobacillus maritimus TaxID=1643336 RepID=UPI00203F7182|nr:ECF transporter S component [Mesobacillus maritimus]MCM3585430.1 ECF transporter S component [Mesobacillus maritimus]MCM3669688.1 ECF transporter S component [Mesobacillus maritimus]
MTTKWNLREIVLMAILGVVFAVIYLFFFTVGTGLTNILTPFGLGPFGYEVIFGIWFIVSIITAYIIRKPGAALISETIAGGVQVLLGSPAGPMLIVSAFIQGLGAEAAFAATKYRNFSKSVLMAAGVGAAVFSFIWGLYHSGYIALSFPLLSSMLIVRVISGALIAGLLGKWITERLADTGVLRSYALGKEWQTKREHKAS